MTSKPKARKVKACKTCRHAGKKKSRGSCMATEHKTQMLPGVYATMYEAQWYAITDKGRCGPDLKLYQALED